VYSVECAGRSISLDKIPKTLANITVVELSITVVKGAGQMLITLAAICVLIAQQVVDIQRMLVS
jgi:hypothetical protein